MSVALLDVHNQFFDNDGDPLAGGLVYTYNALTDAAEATYTDADGSVPHSNPIVLDASGRPPSPIYWTVGTAYKSLLKTSAGVELDSVLSFTIGTAASTTSEGFDSVMTYPGGPPTSSEWLGGERLTRAVNFPANFAGSYFKVPKTLPTASFVVTVKVNNVTKGTLTCSTGGASSTATSGAAAVACVAGDEIDYYGPSSVDATIADFGLTLKGTVA